MKTSSKRFTLIELLIVIAIIGILAGLVFPALGTVRNNAKRSKASTECQSLKTAIIMYESEFSCWPAKVSGSADALVQSKEPGNDKNNKDSEPPASGDDYEYARMCYALVGNNSKKMVFFEAGIDYIPKYGILDPWGRPYQVMLDVDFDGKIKDGSNTKAVSAVNKANGRTGDLRTKVAVYSFGVEERDKIATDLDKLATKKKLVISW